MAEMNLSLSICPQKRLLQQKSTSYIKDSDSEEETSTIGSTRVPTSKMSMYGYIYRNLITYKIADKYFE